MRSSGILLPLFSLPGRYGIGDMGQEAYELIDRLARARQHYLQVLPLNPTTEENCPYQAASCFGGEPLYISPEKLEEKGLLTKADLEQLGLAVSSSAVKIDYDVVKPAKLDVLRMAFTRFRPDHGYEEFCGENASWLNDYAKFMAGEDARDKRELEFHKWTQYEFFSEWLELKSYANDKGVEIIGDMPYFVSYKSVDVKVHPELFSLGDDGSMEFVSGAPADGFTPDGQCWGDPVYNWDRHREDGFSWWIERFRQYALMYDAVRVDHMRGYESFFAIPEETRDPAEGHWEKGPGIELFDAIKTALPGMKIIAEDLGFLTDEVHELIDATGYPGMKVLEFAFDSDESNTYLPFNYTTDNVVVYTGTHDNDTAAGWYEKAADWQKRFMTWYVLEKTEFGEKRRAELESAGQMQIMEKDIYPYTFSPREAAEALVELAFSTRANTCMIPLQDHLALGSEARINVPGVARGNWNWRMPEGALSDKLIEKIASLTEKYDRCAEMSGS